MNFVLEMWKVLNMLLNSNISLLGTSKINEDYQTILINMHISNVFTISNLLDLKL